MPKSHEFVLFLVSNAHEGVNYGTLHPALDTRRRGHKSAGEFTVTYSLIFWFMICDKQMSFFFLL